MYMTYKTLIDDIDKLMQEGGSTLNVIGRSLLGRPIIAVQNYDETTSKGNGILMHGAMHAREHVTSKLALQLYDPTINSDISIVPMTNPDGVEISLNSAKSIFCARADSIYAYKMLLKYNAIKPVLFTSLLSKTIKKSSVGYVQLNSNQKVTLKELCYLIKEWNGTNSDFGLWKANARGVDLNTNYDALWGTGSQNIKYPSSGNYIGEYPFSEIENRILRDYTQDMGFGLTLALHSKGNVIYYGFEDKTPHMELAQQIADLFGYPLLRSYGSAGGYKDWYTLNFDGLGLTIEFGDEDKTYLELYDQLPK